MTPYWILFLVPSMLALTRFRLSSGTWALLGAVVALVIGLRFEVGGDWGSYLAHLSVITARSFREALFGSDPGYYTINWIAGNLGAGIWLVNLICGTVVAAGLIRFIKRLPEPNLALAIAIPYIVIVLAMGYSRQAAAFGFMLWGLVSLADRRNLGFVIAIVFAATFHKSAVLLLPLAVLAATQHRVRTAAWVGISAAVLYGLFLAEKADDLWYAYVESEYAMASEGGAIRVFMNAVPAIVFLATYKRFAMTSEQRALWFWISVFSLACVPLVFQAATAVDRVALYLMPIQLVVWSYAPQLVAPAQRVYVRLAVLGGYAAVLFVWLNYASHRDAWLPYQFWPFV